MMKTFFLFLLHILEENATLSSVFLLLFYFAMSMRSYSGRRRCLTVESRKVHDDDVSNAFFTTLLHHSFEEKE
jgi:hypothetical protein